MILKELKKEVKDLEDPVKFNAVAAEITSCNETSYRNWLGYGS